MIDFSLSILAEACESPTIPVGLVVASLNMLVQILFSVVFGSKGLPKIRGYRGE